jgi:hypothetical protein
MASTSTYTLQTDKDDAGRVVGYRVEIGARTVGSINKLLPTQADPIVRYAPTYWPLASDGRVAPREVGLFDKLVPAINAILDEVDRETR